MILSRLGVSLSERGGRPPGALAFRVGLSTAAIHSCHSQPPFTAAVYSCRLQLSSAEATACEGIGRGEGEARQVGERRGRRGRGGAGGARRWGLEEGWRALARLLGCRRQGRRRRFLSRKVLGPATDPSLNSRVFQELSPSTLDPASCPLLGYTNSCPLVGYINSYPRLYQQFSPFCVHQQLSPPVSKLSPSLSPFWVYQQLSPPRN